MANLKKRLWGSLMARKIIVFMAMFIILHAAHAEAPKKTYPVAFGSYKMDAPLMRPKPSSPFEIAYINFRDDHELVIAAALELSKKVPKGTEAIVILGDKSNGLGVLMANALKLPWIILTSKETPEGSVKIVSYNSITSGNKKMHINKSQLEKLKGKKIIVLDDVISTGGTIRAAIELLKESTAKIQGIMCAFTEEDDRTVIDRHPIIKLGHLPVFPVKRA
jgi:adenine phosphoribosyltransferase